MIRIGFDTRKTGREFIPDQISQTMNHFIRGFSDGDGSFSLSKNRNKMYLEWSLICSSRKFLVEIAYILEAQIFAKVYLTARSDKPHVFRLRTGHRTALKIGDYLYDDATLKLERKYNTFTNAKQIKISKREWTSSKIELLTPHGRTLAAAYAKAHLLGFRYSNRS